MLWWEAALPAVLVALAVRIVAVAFSERYFSWVELLGPGSRDEEQVRARQVALARRLLTPFAVLFLVALLVPERYGIPEGALVGMLGAALIIWPMVFHGLPYGVLRTDWELVPIYGSFVLLFGASAALGIGAAEAVLTAESPVTYLTQTGGTIVLGVVAVGAFWSIYAWTTSRLGRRATARIHKRPVWSDAADDNRRDGRQSGSLTDPEDDTRPDVDETAT